jgi:hypothetical protein
MSKRSWLSVAVAFGLTLASLTAAHTISRRRSASLGATAAATDGPSQRAMPGNGSPLFRMLPAMPVASTSISATNPQEAIDAGQAGAVEGSPQAGERDREMAKVRTSGPDDLGLGAKVTPLQVAWETMANRAGIDIEVSPWECHRGGCFTTVVHQAPESVEALTSQILASPELAKWPGPQTRSAPIPRTDGTAEVTWFLLPPPEGQPR